MINLRRQFRVRKIFFVYVKLSVHKFFRDLRSFRFMFKITIPKVCDLCSRLATSITWTRTLDPDPGPWIRTLKTWTLKNLDPEKPGINIGLKICLTLGSYVLLRPCAM